MGAGLCYDMRKRTAGRRSAVHRFENAALADGLH